MGKKKTLDLNQLEKASGGIIPDGHYSIRCSGCKKFFSQVDANSRKIQEGCSEYHEYECPDCHTWSRTTG